MLYKKEVICPEADDFLHNWTALITAQIKDTKKCIRHIYFFEKGTTKVVSPSITRLVYY